MKGGKKMKRFEKPIMQMEMFSIENVLTTSVTTEPSDSTDPIKPSAPETPPDIFE